MHCIIKGRKEEEEKGRRKIELLGQQEMNVDFIIDLEHRQFRERSHTT